MLIFVFLVKDLLGSEMTVQSTSESHWYDSRSGEETVLSDSLRSVSMLEVSEFGSESGVMLTCAPVGCELP